MRLRLPLIPLAVHVRVEALPWRSALPRFSVRGLALFVGLVALPLGLYLSLVQVPARRLRYAEAERKIDEYLELLDRGIAEAIDRDKETRELYERDLASIEKEEREAEKWPESSRERDDHLLFASQWRANAADVKRQLGRRGEVAQAFRERAEFIRTARRRITNNLFEIETLAAEAEKSPGTRVWKSHALDRTLEDLRMRTPIDAEILKATAIWDAKNSLSRRHPGIKPDRMVVQAKGREFVWSVVFTDPESGKTYPIGCHFSRAIVDQYLSTTRPPPRRGILGWVWP